jgi:hypothetical protein
VEGRLAFAEFLGAYGAFPRGYDFQENSSGGRPAFGLFRKRVAFHRQVAELISMLRRGGELGSLEASGAGDFLPAAALMQLRRLTVNHPEFEAPGEGSFRKPS